MVNIFEVRTVWTPPSGIQTESVHYVGTSGNPSVFRQGLANFYEQVVGSFSSQCGWSIAQNGRIIDDVTGNLLGEWSDPFPFSFAGTGSGQPLPDAAQGLVSFTTGVVRASRFIRGRWFLPGLTIQNLQDGNISAGNIALFQPHLTQLMEPINAMGVWSRPTPERPGHWVKSQQARLNAEVAVLRRRRN